ncbi:hypothetical protein HQ590_13820 [bacterium]|nr:hypothetical protein [bacterium]
MPTTNGTGAERWKWIFAMVREGGFAVFAVLLLGVVCWQQNGNRELQADTIRALDSNTSVIGALKGELHELRLDRRADP